MTGFRTALGLTLLLASRLVAQDGMTADAAVRHLDGVRAEAEPLWRAGDPEGLRVLEDLWSWLDEEPVADLLRGSLGLQTRLPSFAVETACAHAVVGDTVGALAGLEQVRDAGGHYRTMMPFIGSQCPQLAALSELPRYQEILAVWRADELRWSSPSIRTDYRPELSVAERVAGLSLLWYRVKELFPSFEVAPGLDWDSVYLDYIPRVLQTSDTYEYYRTLERFIASLGDSHTNVYFPDALAARRYSRPPLRARLVEDRPIVVQVGSRRLRDLGIREGQEILAIDGLPVDRYVAERVAPYQSAATPQDLAVRSYTYQLLTGSADQPVRLRLDDGAGRVTEVEVPRTGYDDVRPFAVTRDTVLAGNIGYLRLDGFDADTLRTYIPEALERLAATRGLIVDVRWNGGGSTQHGYAILGALVDEAAVAVRPRTRNTVPTYRAWGVRPPAYPLRASSVRPDSVHRYRAPVVVLTGPMTFSAAEDFVMSFDALDLGTIIGEPTAGNTGQPFNFGMPGGGSARVRVKHDSYPDGTEFIGVGIQPDILVRPTVAGIRAGRDEVLDRAITELRRQLGGTR